MFIVAVGIQGLESNWRTRSVWIDGTDIGLEGWLQAIAASVLQSSDDEYEYSIINIEGKRKWEQNPGEPRAPDAVRIGVLRVSSSRARHDLILERQPMIGPRDISL